MIAEIASDPAASAILPAILGGTGTAIAGLIGRILWTARFGKQEDDAKASDSARRAVEAIDGALTALREERKEHITEIGDLKARCRELEGELRGLKSG